MEPILQVITHVNIPILRILYEPASLCVTHTNHYVAFNKAGTNPGHGSVVCATALILLSWASFIVLQTCIVIRRTATYILAGADSKASPVILFKDEHGSTQKSDATRSVCKIQASANNIFFASAGVGRVQSFNVAALAAQACCGAISVQQAMDNFRRLASRPLGEALALIRTHWPEYFQSKFLDSLDDDALRITFFGMEGRSPSLSLVNFKIVATSAMTFRLDEIIYTCPGTIPADKPLVFVLGQTDASARYQDDQRLWDSTPISGIKKVILAEAKARPDTVAPPIDILRLDANGPRWIQSKPECRQSTERQT